ncbi:CpsD/CapB family tyrosine-protein kinase [Cochlodiniinecator piscidefendens]|uniref:CpsD/CapB family tyrosine-protein kinase n=1 Tax=Cochlodiniinecator piscidefendens TaxID=2715756 RepID=UPI00140C4334|nr:CpsD/CapB family tyrosine-protein kinase [Cochlodiniinecator piscidefendens]
MSDQSASKSPEDLSQELRSAALTVVDAWDGLDTVTLNAKILEQSLVISASREHPANKSFDILRTRLLQLLADRGWNRIAITSPTQDCGKTFVATNLAMSISRRESIRTVLIDLDLRNPSLAKVMGVEDTIKISDYLTGHLTPEEYFLRVGPNLVVGLNAETVDAPAEMLQENMTGDVLDEMLDTLLPDVVLYDLPPALSNDDVLSFLPNIDGVLLVASGSMTTAREIRDVELMLGGKKPLIGVVLNKAEDG